MIDTYRYHVVADALTKPGDTLITLICKGCDDTPDKDPRVYTFDIKWPSLAQLHEIAELHDRQHPGAPA
ncbi:hypothetical protein RVR_8294 [Actinacidiphila reveromycinica]|uniref:Uncharacterized protein n=1 Tax=Actinacidiphila reveromycinica TaxID=659352 RepID=A0A7U3UYH4_9ACTN|nr:hypothetical protein [Streptomyces sp. SN-593]BBB01055.1 hypothetical protein RVR_8294 [Streptomyces sp. SN-593]